MTALLHALSLNDAATAVAEWRLAARALADAMTRLRAGGARVEQIALPVEWHSACAIHRTIMLHGAARNLGDLQ